MNCRDWKKRLPALLDEKPGSRERRALAAHLAECPSCSAEWALLCSLRQVSRRLEELEPGPHVWEQIRERLHAGQAEAEVKVEEAWWRRLLPAPLPKISWALAPAAAVLLALAIFHWRQPSQEVAKVTPPAVTPTAAIRDSTPIPVAPVVAVRRAAPVAEPAILTRMPERRSPIPRLTADTVPVFVIETLEPRGGRTYVDAIPPDTELPVFVIHQGRLPEESFIPAPSNYFLPVVSVRKGKEGDF